MPVKTICQVRPEDIMHALAVYFDKARMLGPDGAVSYDAGEPLREMECTLEVRDGYLLIGTPAMSLAIPLEDVQEAVQPELEAYLRSNTKKPEKE